MEFLGEKVEQEKLADLLAFSTLIDETTDIAVITH